MSEREDGVTRRALMTGIAATAGVALVPSSGRASSHARPRSTGSFNAGGLVEQIPSLSSTALEFTNVPAISFRPEASTAVWTAVGGTLVSTTVATYLAGLTPSVNDWFRELDVYLDPGGQSGAIKLTRYHPLSPATAEDVVSGVYPAASGLQNVVFPLDHRADPMFWNYVVSIELKPGVVFHGANLWYRPLTAGFVQLDPLRIYDSRVSDGKLAAGQVRTISAPSLINLSGSALVNLTIDQTEVSGYLTAWASVGENGSPAPETSNINWTTDNQTLANLVVVKLAGEHGDEFNIRADGNGRTHVIVDLLGYFT
jgi:hypothetical protein